MPLNLSLIHISSGHSFDRAKEGYWHLLPVQNTRTKAPGDSREMVAARRAFLSAGYYLSLIHIFSTLFHEGNDKNLFSSCCLYHITFVCC